MILLSEQGRRLLPPLLLHLPRLRPVAVGLCVAPPAPKPARAIRLFHPIVATLPADDPDGVRCVRPPRSLAASRQFPPALRVGRDYLRRAVVAAGAPTYLPARHFPSCLQR